MVIKDLAFAKFLNEAEILKRVRELAAQISKDYTGQSPLILPVLNGSFMFASDLIRKLTVEPRVSFVKHSSYTGGVSAGQLKTIIGLQESVFQQDILIVEDIVDSGQTIARVTDEISALGPNSVEVVSLLIKQKSAAQPKIPKYVGFEIPDQFVVGYGLDYQGLGRQLSDIYQATA